MVLQGLTQKEASLKLKEYGPNEIRELTKISPLNIFLNQIKGNFVIYLLFFAFSISVFVGKTITAYTILIVIIIVLFIGFFQEYRAEKSIAALKKMILPVSIVIRDKKQVEIPSSEIVPGDILIVRTGEMVPADSVIIEEKELRVNEAVLTGESKEVKKTAAIEEKEHVRENMIFTGTYIVNGRGVAKVLHTGMNTEFGKIAAMISKAEKELPLRKKVNNIAKYMVAAGLTISFLTGIILGARNLPLTAEKVVEILIVVIAISVSSFPTGFPVVLMSTLASGAHRMAKKNAIVNRMPVIETLGETTVICSDKTGTITKGEMTVRRIYCDDREIEVSGIGYEGKGEFIIGGHPHSIKDDLTLQNLLRASVICNDSSIEREGENLSYKGKGSPTEIALLILAAKSGLFIEDLSASRVEEIPFSSERKMMTVVSKQEEKMIVFSKGAPEILLEKCSHFMKSSGTHHLTKSEKEKVLKLNQEFTDKKFRVLAFAYRETDSVKENLEKDLIFLGLAAMEDPPREEVKDALKQCLDAGISVKMITGDNKGTAIEIGKEIGLTGEVLSGEDIDAIEDEELRVAAAKTAIFARVLPKHKLRIVKALKENGEIVTMTGDGVNDAPALKEAHIGVAMGKNGTDVSREAADLILKDDNFATIVSAIIEGRTILKNMQKFVTFQLSNNFAELFIIFVSVLLNLPLPLLALQILFMNLVTDSIPAITLGFNPPSYDVMRIKAKRKLNILNKKLIMLLATTGTVMGSLCLGAFIMSFSILGQGIDAARTTTLITLIFLEIVNAFNFRSFRYPIHKLPLFANKYLVYASIISITATALVVYSPLNKAFETVPLPLFDITIPFLSAFLLILIVEVSKTISKARYEPS